MIPRGHTIAIFAIVLAMFAISVGFYPQLPDPAPIHWNIRGEVDGHGPRWVAAFLGPMILSGVILLMFALPVLGPFRSNFEQFKVTYGRCVVLISAMLFALHTIILLASVGAPIGIGRSICAVLGIMFMFLGNWLGKIRRNFYIGIRTPWTLANDLVWEKTHRVGGRMFFAAGLAAMLSVPFGNDFTSFIVLFVAIGVTAVFSIAYSYVCYRKLGSVDDLASSR